MECLNKNNFSKELCKPVFEIYKVQPSELILIRVYTNEYKDDMLALLSASYQGHRSKSCVRVLGSRRRARERSWRHEGSAALPSEKPNVQRPTSGHAIIGYIENGILVQYI